MKLFIEFRAHHFGELAELLDVAVPKVMSNTRLCEVEGASFVSNNWCGASIGRPIEVLVGTFERKLFTRKGGEINIKHHVADGLEWGFKNWRRNAMRNMDGQQARDRDERIEQEAHD